MDDPVFRVDVRPASLELAYCTLTLLTPTPKIEAAPFSKVLLFTYATERWHESEDRSPKTCLRAKAEILQLPVSF
jgi:hypothetical protein